MSRENVYERVERTVDAAVLHFKSGKNVLDLPENLANIFTRWEMAHRITKKNYQRGKEYVFSVYSIWLSKNFNINDPRTAREDLYAAPILFTKIDPVNREFKRMLSIERLEKSILKAEKAGKFAEQARLEAVLFKYLNPADDPQVEDSMDDVAKNFQIAPVFDPKLLGVPNYSLENVMKFKEKMILKKKKLINEDDNAQLIDPEEDDE